MPLTAVDTIAQPVDPAVTEQADSAAAALADSLAQAGRPTFGPVPYGRSAEAQAPTSPYDQAVYITRPPAWMQGIGSEQRMENPADNAGVLSLVVGILVLIGLNAGHVRRLFRSLPQKLWSVRKRDNAFDENTSNETRTLGLLILQLCIFEGVLLYIWLGQPARGHIFACVAALAGVTLVFYLFELAAVRVVGFTFTDAANSLSWRRGLNASSALLGFALALPALIALFYPALATPMLFTAFTLYILSRILFVLKGFRIFYTNFPSLLYFILYLCTLEIIPVIAVYISATEICKSL